MAGRTMSSIGEETFLVLAEMKKLTSSQERLEHMVTEVLELQRGIGSASLSSRRGSKQNHTPVLPLQPENCEDQGREGRDFKQLQRQEALVARASISKTLPGDFVAHTLPLKWPRGLPMRLCIKRLRESVSMDMGLCFSHELTDLKPTDHHTSIRKEATRCLIRPGSTVHVTICLVSFLVLLFDFATFPVMLAWDLEIHGILKIATWVSSMFWTLDIAFGFRTGFYHQGELTTSPGAMAKRYLMTWFWLDLLAVAGDWLSLLTLIIFDGIHESSGGIRILRGVKLIRFLRILDMFRLIRFLNVIMDYMEKQMVGSFRIVVKTASVFFGTLLLVHILCCGWYAMAWITNTGSRWMDHFASPDASEMDNYIVAFHWATAQITLGGSDVSSTNPHERVYNIICMFLGLLFSCTLMSSLSAAMIEFQWANREHKLKLQGLQQYLESNAVSSTTSLLVQDQVRVRLLQHRKQNEMGISCIIGLLPANLHHQLLTEVFLPHLNTHPLLRIWNAMHPATIAHLCTCAVDFIHLQSGDELFEAGVAARGAYYVAKGDVRYIQRPDTSAVQELTVRVATKGAWLCEAALWSEWVHVGTLEATSACKFVYIQADQLSQIIMKHRGISTISWAYCQSFYNQVAAARPPEAEFPTDLEVPHTSFAELVLTMNPEAQRMIGILTLNHYGGCSSPKPYGGSHGAGPREVDDLLCSISSGKEVVILSPANEIEQVVCKTAVCIKASMGEVFMQVARLTEHGIVPACGLPACREKLKQRVPTGTPQTPSAAKLKRLQTTKMKCIISSQIPLLDGKVEFRYSEREVTSEWNQHFNVSTKCVRKICHANLIDDFEAPTCRVKSLPPQRARRRFSLRKLKYGGSEAEEAERDVLAEYLLDAEVYVLQDKWGGLGFFSWIRPDVSELLGKHSHSDILEQWIARFTQEQWYEAELTGTMSTAVSAVSSEYSGSSSEPATCRTPKQIGEHGDATSLASVADKDSATLASNGPGPCPVQVLQLLPSGQSPEEAPPPQSLEPPLLGPDPARSLPLVPRAPPPQEEPASWPLEALPALPLPLMPWVQPPAEATSRCSQQLRLSNHATAALPPSLPAGPPEPPQPATPATPATPSSPPATPPARAAVIRGCATLEDCAAKGQSATGQLRPPDLDCVTLPWGSQGKGEHLKGAHHMQKQSWPSTEDWISACNEDDCAMDVFSKKQ